MRIHRSRVARLLAALVVGLGLVLGQVAAACAHEAGGAGVPAAAHPPLHAGPDHGRHDHGSHDRGSHDHGSHDHDRRDAPHRSLPDALAAFACALHCGAFLPQAAGAEPPARRAVPSPAFPDPAALVSLDTEPAEPPPRRFA